MEQFRDFSYMPIEVIDEAIKIVKAQEEEIKK